MKLYPNYVQAASLGKEVSSRSPYQKSKSLDKKSNAAFASLGSLVFPSDGTKANNMLEPIKDLHYRKATEKAKSKKQSRSSQKQQRENKKRPTTAGTKRVKNFIGNKLQKRLEAYYLFLSLARQVLGVPVCRNLKEHKKYLVYIGKGNNSKLIKKLFYSRHWWNVTSNPQDPHINIFWTQWSKNCILSRLSSQQIQHELENRIICPQQSKRGHFYNQYNYLMGNKQRNHSKSTYVETEAHVKNYIQSINARGDKKNTISMTCNHIEGHEFITDKKNLFLCLKQYCENKGESCFEILPLTFHVRGLAEELTELQQVEKQLSQRDKKIMWIVKPGQKSNRGNGIQVLKKIAQIREFIDKETEKHTKRTYIIQKYIYPALFHRRKFDIRCFVLVVASPAISAFFYNGGYIRTSSKQFRQKKCDDKFMHLTNDAVQKKGNDYGKYQKGNKITFEQYQDFLDLFQKRDIKFAQSILPRIKMLSAKSIAACSGRFNSSNKSYSFQLLGYDFMIDQDYRPWLIQVNTNPCLETGCPILDNFIPAALNNVIKLAVDSVFRPPKINSWHLQQVITFPESILEQNKLQLIFQQVRK